MCIKAALCKNHGYRFFAKQQLMNVGKIGKKMHQERTIMKGDYVTKIVILICIFNIFPNSSLRVIMLIFTSILVCRNFCSFYN